MHTTTKSIPSIGNDGNNASYFDTHNIQLNGEESWMLSEQQAALNFRLRSSDAGYESDWHVAGDPTLLIILAGVIEIELRDGSSMQFAKGDMFVAQDYLNGGLELHAGLGHRARVVGNESLQALQLKLGKR